MIVFSDVFFFIKTGPNVAFMNKYLPSNSPCYIPGCIFVNSIQITSDLAACEKKMYVLILEHI